MAEVNNEPSVEVVFPQIDPIQSSSPSADVDSQSNIWLKAVENERMKRLLQYIILIKNGRPAEEVANLAEILPQEFPNEIPNVQNLASLLSETEMETFSSMLQSTPTDSNSSLQQSVTEILVTDFPQVVLETNLTEANSSETIETPPPLLEIESSDNSPEAPVCPERKSYYFRKRNSPYFAAKTNTVQTTTTSTCSSPNEQNTKIANGRIVKSANLQLYLEKKCEYQRRYRQSMSAEKRKEYLRKHRESVRKSRDRQKRENWDEYRRKKSEQQRRYLARLRASQTNDEISA